MEPAITTDIVVAYSQCPRKAYLLLFSPDKGAPHEYGQILEQQRCANQERYVDRLKQTHADVQPYSLEHLRKGSKVLINAHLQVDGFAADCGVLTRVEGTSMFGKYGYEPSIFAGTHSISKEQKLELSFVGYVLERLQSTRPVAGKIIGMDGTSHAVKLGDSSKALAPLLEPLYEWIKADSPTPPPIVLNKHCPLCPFQRMCQTQAEQEDNLSLLDGVTARMMRQYEKKGIFTVKQLSYLFKPRKAKKRSRKLPPVTHKVELQALAIREKKIYLQELPVLSRQPVELFVDMEGVPDRGLYYLIGVLVCQGDTMEHYSFWANTDQDERHIWQQFFDKVAQYLGAPIYHYGSYEPRAIATLARRYQSDAESLTKRLVNVNRYIYGKVYFPVRSNGLKDIGHCIGAKWTSADASGLQALVWRHHWEKTQDATYRELLVDYNKEDCQVLQLLTYELTRIQHSADILSEVDFADKHRQRTTEVGEEIHSQLEEMLKFAHVNYDKKKISFRKENKRENEKEKNEGKKRGALKLRQKLLDTKLKAQKLIQLTSEKVCPTCGYEPLRRTQFMSKRLIIDLVLTRSGFRKVITEYVGVKSYCPKCSRNYAPAEIRKYPDNQLYGYGFRRWFVYQRVAMRISYKNIAQMAADVFNENIDTTTVLKCIKDVSRCYIQTENLIIDKMLKNPFIHVDETKINIQGVNWYGWVFTDGRHVIFKLTETREANIVHEILAKYNGTLISDFYPGYDSVQCKQQKCWVHLIRDLNNDLRENISDAEYEVFVLEVKNLIIPIMETIQEYGLKKRYLNKFKIQIDKFYQKVISPFAPSISHFLNFKLPVE
jgi:predicted RecB family nuclease